jgi:predicted RNase H-like nuclease
MTDYEMRNSLNPLREEYRRQMNAASEKAQMHAEADEMDEVVTASIEAERYREAFEAVCRAILIADRVMEKKKP